jgi:hypothetical protein
MLFQQLNRSDAEKVFIIVKNTSGASLAANLPVYFETDEVSDGVAVSQMVTGGNLLFAGINNATLADDAYGLVQVYGKRTSAVVSPVVSSYSLTPGQRCVGVAGAAYLAYGSALSAGADTDAKLLPSLDAFVISMETIASADGKSATANASVFIRAL